jgi:CHAD domain-containing protein
MKAMSKPRTPRWDARGATSANARRELPRLVEAWFARVRELLAEDPPPQKLHPIRLETKRLRYTLELFRPRYGPGLETRLAALRRIQQLLGEVNDCSITERWIGQAMKASPMRARIEKFLQETGAARAQAFHAAWSEFDAPGREIWWTRYLARHARAASGSTRSSRPPAPVRPNKTPRPGRA